MRRMLSNLSSGRLTDAVLFVLFCCAFLWMVVELGGMWMTATGPELFYD